MPSRSNITESEERIERRWDLERATLRVNFFSLDFYCTPGFPLASPQNDSTYSALICGDTENAPEQKTSWFHRMPHAIQIKCYLSSNVQEARNRRMREAPSAPPADPSRAAEMDNASFVATLPPELRREVLLSADEALLNTLPPNLVAEAMVMRERAPHQV